MYAIFTSQKKEKVMKLERKLYFLVDKKEKKVQAIDDHGRDLVMTLHNYVSDYEQKQKSGINYRVMMKEVKRYIRENQHYL